MATTTKQDGSVTVNHTPTKSALSTISEHEAASEGHETLKEKNAGQTGDSKEQKRSDEPHYSIHDRLFATVISQVIPSQHAHPNSSKATMRIGRKPKEGPEFSVRLMSHNFRRFNARIGFFVPIHSNVKYVMSWQQPTATLSFLAVYTLICLEPRLLPVLPFGGIVFGIMIPSFLALHPTPSRDAEVESSLLKVPRAPPAELEPVPELSVEFWKNLAVLQNSMGKFSDLYDTVNEDLLGSVNFTDEGVSSALFPVMLALGFMASFGTSLLSWQISALVGGWVTMLGSHPAVKKFIASVSDLDRLRRQLQTLQTTLRRWSQTAVVLDEHAAEVRQVEIFELQRHHAHSDTWEPWLFSAAPYEPLSPSRATGTRAKGTQFFDDVRAPAGWRWHDPQWHLDLFNREWVEQRMITGVEVETEGERWVYDIPPADEVIQPETPTKPMRRRTSSVPRRGWEETSAQQHRGEWRRRRWTRLVTRDTADKRSDDRFTTAD